jgi:twitching motility protein PilT
LLLELRLFPVALSCRLPRRRRDGSGTRIASSLRAGLGACVEPAFLASERARSLTRATERTFVRLHSWRRVAACRSSFFTKAGHAMNFTDSAEVEMKRLLVFLTRHEASDLHLKVGYPPYVRIGGHLRKLELPVIPDTGFVHEMVRPLVPEARWGEYESRGALDFSAAGESGDRYRINIYRSKGDMHVAVRRVQSKIADFDALNLPETYRELTSQTLEGLILVCGVTGSGKSSTLAAMLEYINQNRGLHIITIEDPIEFSFQGKRSIISQREIGIDSPSFKDALRVVVRQDPDAILIGEMRDRETMLAAIQAAETGHLVLGSLHCADAQLSFARILEFFDRSEHSFIRSSLANSLRAILCQRLLPGVTEGLRYPATEVLLANAIVRDKILREEDEDIPALLHQCRAEGMRDYTYSLCELVHQDRILRTVAMDYAPSREALSSALKGIDSTSQGIIARVRA